MKKLSLAALLGGLFCGTAQADFSGTYDTSLSTPGGPLGNNAVQPIPPGARHDYPRQ